MRVGLRYSEKKISDVQL